MSTERSVRVRWLGKYRTEIDIRGTHRIQGDEAVEYGGEDAGPMPTELFLASLASCLCLAVSHFARKQRVELAELSVDAWAKKDEKLFRFHEVQLTVSASLPQEKLDSLVQRAKNYCFVSNTVIEGCRINLSSRSSRGRLSAKGR